MIDRRQGHQRNASPGGFVDDLDGKPVANASLQRKKADQVQEADAQEKHDKLLTPEAFEQKTEMLTGDGGHSFAGAMTR